jgi:hypothetical protein
MLRSWLLGLALAAMTVSASAQVYEWRDAQGRLIYGDMPPVGVDAKLIRGASIRPAPAPGQEGAAAEPEPAADEDETPQETIARGLAAVRDQACGQARGQLAALESEERIARVNAQGEREFLTDEQRAEEIERIQGFVSENCD